MFSHIRKLILVIFITVLIWVWADQALTRSTIAPATIAVDKSTDPQLWVSFDNQQSTASMRLRLSGSASKITAIEQKLKEGSLRLELFINPAEEKIAVAGTHPFKLLPLIQKSRIIADLGLQVESVEPETVNVNVVQLAKQTLTMQVLDDKQLPLKDAAVEPATIEMLVRQDWSGDMLKATVALMPQEIEQARTAGIWRKPTVEFAPGTVKTADTQVKITLPSTQQRLKEFSIEAKIGYVFSPNLAGKYKVELVNQNLIIGTPIKILATDEAKSVYESTPYKMLLNINEDDEKTIGELTTRLVVFNLPQEYVSKKEISIAEPEPRMAKFKLIPIEAPEKPAATP
jgi:hypothetical protein